MSVSGLAEGFLAGFNTMDRYQRGQKEDERMDKAMGLRDAMWQNEQERQKVADERYQSELAYREGRDKLADAKYDKQFALTERQMKASEARAGAAERRAAAQEARQQQEYEWQKTLRDKQLFQQENLPIIQSEMEAANKSLKTARKGQTLSTIGTGASMGAMLGMAGSLGGPLGALAGAGVGFLADSLF